MKTLFLSADDIRYLVRSIGVDALMDALIERLTNAFCTYDADRVRIPARSGFAYHRPEEGLLEWMPCLDNGEVIIKVVGYHPNNTLRWQLPTIVSTISAYETVTGHLRCLMDGTLLTALRTGATSAVATRLMAVPQSSTIGLIGGGAQAVTQLHALSRVLDVKRVYIFDINPVVQQSFAARAGRILASVPITGVSIKQLVEEADVICTVTSVPVGKGPVFDGLMPQPWVHINAVGSDFTGKVELPVSLLRQSFVCPDFREQAMREGECQQLAPEEIGPSLYELVQEPERYRGVREQRTVFDSTGWALADQVAMALLREEAAKYGLGMDLQVEQLPVDIYDPYHFE